MRPRLAALFVGLAFAFLYACDSAPEASDGVEITALVAYTAGAGLSAGDIEGRVRQAFAETNGVYEQARVGLRLVPVHFVEVDYEVADRLEALAQLLRTDDGVLDELHVLRDRHEADVVVLVSATPGATINAAVMAEASTAFVIVRWESLGAPDYALAHEIGHLQGARHAPDQDAAMEPFPYGHGFRNDSVRTIMAVGPQRKVPFFSGPDQQYEGVVLGGTALHDVARVLRETAAYISNFRGPHTATAFVPPGTWPVLPDLEGRFQNGSDRRASPGIPDLAAACRGFCAPGGGVLP